jgi:hypothetical protein
MGREGSGPQTQREAAEAIACRRVSLPLPPFEVGNQGMGIGNQDYSVVWAS